MFGDALDLTIEFRLNNDFLDDFSYITGSADTVGTTKGVSRSGEVYTRAPNIEGASENHGFIWAE